MFSFASLPFEVLLHIFGTLDHSDIYSVCLVSRALDEIATPVLYTAMVWNSEAGFVYRYGEWKYKPCVVFQRRPFLRNHVRTVIFRSMGYRWGSSAPKDGLQNVCEELCKLPLIYSLRWSQQKHGDPTVALESFIPMIDTVAKLRAVRELHLPCIQNAGTVFLDGIKNPLTAITVRGTQRWDAVRHWLDQHKHSLRELNLLAINCEISLPKGFQALRRFSLVSITNFSSFMQILDELRQLKELLIGVYTHIMEAWEIGFKGAARLELLDRFEVNIATTTGSLHLPPANAVVSAALKCYLSIAEHSSQLRTLHMFTNLPGGRGEAHGDKLINTILRNHETTIRSLRLDDMTASNETLMRLFSRCAVLEELGIHAADPNLSLGTVVDLVPLTATFQQLNLTLSYSLPLRHLSEAQRFLSQAAPHLRRISISNGRGHSQSEDIPLYVTWERQWVYDEDLGIPLQRINRTLNSSELWAGSS